MTGPDHSGSGWTIGRIIGLIVGLAGMAGFGVCSLVGLVASGARIVRHGELWETGLVMAFVVPGLGLTLLCFLLVRAMIRRSRGASRE